MKIPNIIGMNNSKIPIALLSLTLIFSSLYVLNYQAIYSQTSEDPKSLNCKDNKDQSQYISNVSSEVKSNGGVPVTNDLPGFHYVKKFDSNGTLVSALGTKGTGPG
ncbi:MAG: hypothetical protein QN543_08505, partial [Nitrososphaeraceae archaeon]|nr:hypothetical protein [Nitrososphaeraceae archaeon]